MHVRRRFHLPLPGLAIIGMSVLVLVVAMHTQFNVLFLIHGLLVAGLVISILLSGMTISALEAQLVRPANGAVGEPLSLRYRVRNRSRWLPAFSLYVEELPALDDAGDGLPSRPWQSVASSVPSWILHVAAGETTHADTVAWPTMRGRLRFDRCRLHTSFPLGLVVRSSIIEHHQRAYVFPRLYRLRTSVLRSLGPEGPVGMRMSLRSGHGDEYYGLREHRPGESLRFVSWKLSARRDELVCIDRTRPSPPKLRVILDLATPTDRLRIPDEGHGPRRKLEEEAISLAASILYAAHAADFEIGLTIIGVPGLDSAVRRSTWHLSRLFAALACIDLDVEDRTPRRATAVAERSSQVVVHPARVEPGAAREDALHLSARRLADLVEGPLGWDPTRLRYAGEAAEPGAGEMSAASGESNADGGSRARERAPAASGRGRSA